MSVTMNIQELNTIIRFHRQQSGLTQRDLADLAGVGKTAVFDLEKGKPTVRLDTLLKVCHALNIQLTLDSPLMPQWRSQNPEAEESES
jgi:HTH-type transcriptional regulator/antitoxin HipB